MIAKFSFFTFLQIYHDESSIFDYFFFFATNNCLPGQINSNSVGEGKIVNPSKEAIAKFKSVGLIRYSDLGAKGDGKTDDLQAIVATHTFANQHQLKVQADDGATYYIGGKARTAIIQTNTDFRDANFIIDDRKVKNNRAPIFLVSSRLKAFKPKGISSLKRNQKKVNLSLPQACLISVTNAKVKHYIRFGRNQNNGSNQTDIFIADKNGKIDMDAPIIWDFEQITDIQALPIDKTTLNITGGNFTTIANQEESKYNYYSRNLEIQRSNVIVDGLKHTVIGEGDHGAPYRGFISISDCANVSIQNTVFTGHKTYQTIGSAGVPVSMGSYDISISRSLNVSFLNCSQTNNIDDPTYWGLMGSNYCKNLVLDNCTFSRFDAHKGVANATVRNSTLGHMGINAIGSGTFRVENCTIRGRSIINLRPDYGSTWQGKFIIRDCTFIPRGGKTASANLISGYYTGQHNFGYTCYMPEQILIENLQIEDTNHPEGYQGPTIFTKFNEEMVDDTYVEQFPYVRTQKVILKKVSTASGKAISISDNPFFFKEVKVKNR